MSIAAIAVHCGPAWCVVRGPGAGHSRPLDQASPQACKPVARLLPVRRNGKDQDDFLLVAISHGEGKALDLGPSGTRRTWRTCGWKPSNESERGVHGGPETPAGPRIFGLVELNFMQEFVARLATEQHSLQGASCSASAMTASTSKSSPSPRSCSLTRRSISAAQAFSMGEAGDSSSDSSRRSRSRTRSSGARVRPASAICCTRSCTVSC